MRGPRLLLGVLLLGTVASIMGIAATAIWNWFFRGELGLTRDTITRLVILGFVVGSMPVGLAWARARKQKS